MRINTALALVVLAAITAQAAPQGHGLASSKKGHASVSAKDAQTPKNKSVFTSLEKKLANYVQEAVSTAECGACISALVAAKGLAELSTNWFIDAGQGICKLLKVENPTVCAGVLSEQGPIIADMLVNMDITGGDGQLFCAAVANICTYPAVTPYTVPFPKPKPANAVAPTPSGQTFNAVHLSDWHYDPLYKEGAEAACTDPLCCRAESTIPSNITRAANKWGDYNCDQPYILGESAVKYIAANVQNLKFSILTGDIPPHNVWETLPTSALLNTESTAYSLLHSTFDPLNIPIYPAVGNHEAAPVNGFILNSIDNPDYSDQYLYNSLASQWAGWLPAASISSVQQNSGSYVLQRPDGLVVISLNTNFCYVENFWLYQRTGELDPNGILGWLVQQLQAAEDAGKRVWIIGHIPPGLTDCLHDYSNYYYQVIERYSPHVIAAQFFGHTHRDEFELFYEGANQDSSDALNVAYIGPSITPYTKLNPGFRVYSVDAKTFDVMDTVTYIANLDQASTWTNGPNWHVEYTARQAYFPTLPANQALTASVWHDLTVRFESDPAFFTNTYFLYRGKSANLQGSCDATCQSNLVCGLRAGKSELECSYTSALDHVNNVEKVAVRVKNSVAKNRAVKKNVVKNNDVAEQDLWNKPLCGFHGMF